MTNNNNQCEWKHSHKKNIYHFCNEFENIRQENMFFIFLYHYFTYHVFRWIRKQVILRSSYSSECKRKEFITCLCFLSINNDYKSHIFFNLISEIWFKEKWVKTWILIDSRCESMNTIDMRYVWKQHLKTWKFEYNMILIFKVV